MGKEVLTSRDQKKSTAIRLLLFKECRYSESISIKKIFLVRKTISTLLVTCIMIIKLSHYV